MFKCLLFSVLSNFCHLQIGYTWSLLTTRIPGVDILPPKTGTGVEQAIVGKVGGGGTSDKLSYCRDGKNVNYNLGQCSGDHLLFMQNIDPLKQIFLM